MRIAVLADVHLGTSNTQFPGQDLGYAPAVLRAAVPRLRAARADQLVIVGDLVNMGAPEEYSLASAALSELDGLPVVSIPGNHELVRGSMNDFMRLAPGGTMSGSATHPNDSVTVLYLNSAMEGLGGHRWHGLLDDAGLTSIEQATVHHPHRPILAFCHHPPEGTVHVAPHPMMGLMNTDEVMVRLLRHPSPIVLVCGHTHVPDVYRRRNLTILGCPSLCFWPHAFLVMDLADGHLHVTTHRVIEEAASSPDPSISVSGYVAARSSWVPELSLRLR